MQRLKVFAIALLALLTAAVVTAGSASALVSEHPEFTVFPNKISAISATGEPKFTQLGNALSILCKTVEATPGMTNEVTSSTHGKVDILFLGCRTSLLNTCTGLPDTTAGSILTKALFLLRYRSTTDLTAIVKLEPEEVHFECAGILVSVRGTVCAPITPVAPTKTKNFTTDLKTNGTAGDQKETTVANEKRTATEACGLESEFNGGAFTMSAEAAEGKVETTTAAEILT